EERLASGPKHAWTEAFLEAISKNSEGWRKYPRLKNSDLNALVGPAIDGASDLEEAARALLVSADRCLRSAVPGALGILKQRGMRFHWDAAFWLVHLRAQEAIPEVLSLLD